MMRQVYIIIFLLWQHINALSQKPSDFKLSREPLSRSNTKVILFTFCNGRFIKIIHAIGIGEVFGTDWFRFHQRTQVKKVFY